MPNRVIRFLISWVLAAGTLSGAQAQIIALEAPEVIRVSVDTATGNPFIEWKASVSPDVAKYELYYDDPNDAYPLGEKWLYDGTVDGDTRKYEFMTLDPDSDPWTLTVQAYDTIGNRSNYTDYHTTMHLEIAYDSCEKYMILDWTSYRGWGEIDEPGSDLVKYEVYWSLNGGTYTLLDPQGTKDTSDYHLGITDNNTYAYFIKAVRDDNNFSFSNIVVRNVRYPLHPGWINAGSASVTGPATIEVKFTIDPAAEVRDYQLYKSSGPGKPFISDAVFSGLSDSLSYQDPVLSTSLRYQYKLYSLDVCNQPVQESSICGNVVLSASSVGLETFLSWNPYETYEAGVKEYRVYRDINQTGAVLTGGVSHPDTTFEDDLSFLSSQEIQDEICYIIEAVENEGGTRGNRGISRSNTACVSVVPEVQMANAIIPNSLPPNNQIKPLLTFIPRQYLFQVYDRWGNRIFETTDPETAWTGSMNGGKNVPEGVYVYHLRLTTSNGIDVVKNGQITVFYK